MCVHFYCLLYCTLMKKEKEQYLLSHLYLLFLPVPDSNAPAQVVTAPPLAQNPATTVKKAEALAPTAPPQTSNSIPATATAEVHPRAAAKGNESKSVSAPLK